MLTYYPDLEPKVEIPEDYETHRFVVLRACGHTEEIRTHAPPSLYDHERKAYDAECVEKAERPNTKCKDCRSCDDIQEGD